MMKVQAYEKILSDMGHMKVAPQQPMVITQNFVLNGAPKREPKIEVKKPVPQS
jgi:hypothetical protein